MKQQTNDWENTVEKRWVDDWMNKWTSVFQRCLTDNFLRKQNIFYHHLLFWSGRCSMELKLYIKKTFRVEKARVVRKREREREWEGRRKEGGLDKMLCSCAPFLSQHWASSSLWFWAVTGYRSSGHNITSTAWVSLLPLIKTRVHPSL